MGRLVAKRDRPLGRLAKASCSYSIGEDRSLVELVHVKKSFGDVVAVDEVSLEVGAGEFVTLLGLLDNTADSNVV